MRVVHFVESFSVLTESWLYHMITSLNNHGVDGHVITMNKRVNLLERPFDNVHVLEFPPKFSIERFAASIRRRARLVHPIAQYNQIFHRRLHSILSQLEPDVIIAHFGPMGVIAAPVARRLDIPLVVGFYGYDISRLLTEQYWRAAYAEIASQTALVIGISRHVCKRLEEVGFTSDNIRLIHLGIDISAFPYSDPLERFDGQEIRCIHVGTLNHKKSPLNLLKAFSRAHAELSPNLSLKLTIAGDGPLRREAEQLVEELGIASAVTFLGSVRHSQIPKLLQQAHIYTQHCVTAPNGDQEGQGVSFVEASASGLPIVSTHHNGISDVVLDDKTGYLVPEGDYEAMADRIVELCKNPKKWKQMGLQGRDHVKREFSIDNQSRKIYQALYQVIES